MKTKQHASWKRKSAEKTLVERRYGTVSAVAADVDLVCNICCTVNGPDSATFRFSSRQMRFQCC
ncbi:hypothetical protein C823_006468 [Eubacterium plexicaudatum ASF492]|uniref:Uncharacterized protein n=1 Tax=Eubacterium plexicaudatum ASF492 TaxID=1235802 RepID=N2ACV4_9FIRM|nr:hypothetical protein C823_006468 [Eubacterium plexicaudatum ASF492]